MQLRAEGGRLPKGGYVLTWPLDGEPGTTRINGHLARWVKGELRIDQIPAEIEVVRASP
jgi:hypothetical protein